MSKQDEITVSVVKFTSKPFLMLRAFDPATGKTIHRSSKTAKRSEASKLAGLWEEELRNGVVQTSKVTWIQFREKYENDVLTGLAPATDEKVQGVFNTIERILKPTRLRDLTSERLSYLQSKLREAKLSESTIKSHLSHLKAALRWAVKIGWLPRAPEITMPKRAKGSKAMRGRPISGEEFDRVLAAVPKVVGNDAAPAWQHYLQGLWSSGLRLGESLQLSWDDDSKLCVDMQPGEHPMLRIRAELEKGNQDRLLPMAPEFAEFLQQTPAEQRKGFVFNPCAKRQPKLRIAHDRVGHLISMIGKRAGIKVASDADGRAKFATAHDLRRSFGLRWSSRVMPQVLMELMRHESIDTTLRYYTGRQAQNTAAVLWAAHKAATGNDSGNGGRNGGDAVNREIVEN